MGMLSIMCNQRMILRSVAAFIRNVCDTKLTRITIAIYESRHAGKIRRQNRRFQRIRYYNYIDQYRCYFDPPAEYPKELIEISYFHAPLSPAANPLLSMPTQCNKDLQVWISTDKLK